MLNLIFKDLLYLKKQLLGVTLFTLFIIFATHSSGALYVASSTIVAYLAVLNNNMHDDKNNSQVLLNSLPVRRRDVVLTKYLSFFIYVAIGLFMVVLISLIANAALSISTISYRIRPIGIFDIIGSPAVAMLFFSFYFPLYFKFTMIKILSYINVCFYLILFAGGLRLMTWLGRLHIIMNTPGWVLGTAAMILSVAILLVSLRISLIIYQNKDF